MNLKKVILILILVSLTLILSGNGRKETQHAKEHLHNPQTHTSISQTPEFALLDQNGKEVKLSDHKGKIVVLEWSNYDCPFVKAHYEKNLTMANLAKKYADKNVIWLNINSTKYANIETNKAWALKYKLPFPVLDDHSGKVGRLYGAKTTPHMFVIDTKGETVYQGAIDNSPIGRKVDEYVNYVDNALVELTTGRKISIPQTKPYGCSVKYAK